MNCKDFNQNIARAKKVIRPVVPFICLGLGLSGLSGVDVLKCYPYGTDKPYDLFLLTENIQETVDISQMAQLTANNLHKEEKYIAFAPATPHVMCDLEGVLADNIKMPKVKLFSKPRPVINQDENVPPVEDVDQISDCIDTDNTADVEDIVIQDGVAETRPIEPETFVEHKTNFVVTNDYVYTHGVINARYGPNKEWSVKFKLPKGAKVLRIAKGQYGWDKIEYNGMIAYAWRELLHNNP